MATTTYEERLQVYRVLDAEQNKAHKAMTKAESVLNGFGYACCVERETAAVLLSLRQAQYQAAFKVASEYFDNYVKPLIG